MVAVVELPPTMSSRPSGSCSKALQKLSYWCMDAACRCASVPTPRAGSQSS
jgi:hypothetical protein